ncbi:hypothetical protein GTH52_04520 [Clostridium tyrobutyricum]|jgi:hypothetical protein|nr:hypothetical protein GTH52_04520 [Clostridium tyrobutyricum]
MIYIGIDAAKNKHDCCITDSNSAVHNTCIMYFYLLPYLYFPSFKF